LEALLTKLPTTSSPQETRFARNITTSTNHLLAGPPPVHLLVKKDVPLISVHCIYREAQSLRSSFDSICHYVDALVILDGRFLDFPELPEDGTNQIISETASRFDPKFGGEQKFVVFKTEPSLEVEKRELAFRIVKPGCFIFILDGDEICVGDVKAGLDFVRSKAEDGISVFWVYVDEPKGNPGWKPRIIKVEEGLRYGKNHWTILRENGQLLTDSIYREREDFTKIENFKILNLGFTNRNDERKEQCVAYKDLWIGKSWEERKS
jgi:hypothetical protein